jgi:hypothetical protein
MKLGMYVMTPEPISTAYLRNPSHQSVCRYVYPSIVAKATARYKFYRGDEYTHNNRRNVGRVFFYAVRVESKESRKSVLPRTFFLPNMESRLIMPLKKNSGASVRQRTIPTERPPLVGEVSANFRG